MLEFRYVVSQVLTYLLQQIMRLYVFFSYFRFIKIKIVAIVCSDIAQVFKSHVYMLNTLFNTSYKYFLMMSWHCFPFYFKVQIILLQIVFEAIYSKNRLPIMCPIVAFLSATTVDQAIPSSFSIVF